MPLTPFQDALLAVLSEDRTDERYLAGGAAIHIAPNSMRYSNDLDFFHDSEARVGSTFARDRAALESRDYIVAVEISQPGFIRAVVSRGTEATRVDWAHDSAWRFLPLVRAASGGLLLHPIDLAINKTLALAGRDEPRDLLDTLYVHERVLPVGALCWAAVGKDPGFTPLSLLELLKRRGRFQPEAFARLDLVAPVDAVTMKSAWRGALESAEAFITRQPPDEIGCLYWSDVRGAFVMPTAEELAAGGIRAHWGAPGGVVPRVATV